MECQGVGLNASPSASSTSLVRNSKLEVDFNRRRSLNHQRVTSQSRNAARQCQLTFAVLLRGLLVGFKGILPGQVGSILWFHSI
jgi:hypothetical protein